MKPEIRSHHSSALPLGARAADRYRPAPAASSGPEAAKDAPFAAFPLRRRPIRLRRRFDLPAARVFDAWLAADVAGQWLFATATNPMTQVELDPRVAGSFRFVEQRHGETLEHCGTYVEIIPYRRLVFTLHTADQPHIVTRVSVDIAPLKRGCELMLTHDNVPSHHVIRTRQRWAGVLYGLGVTLGSHP